MSEKEQGTREKLLESALRVLGKYGLRKLSQLEVSKDAGVRQSHLTYYFPKRIDLLVAVLRKHVDSVVADLQRLGPWSRGGGSGLPELVAGLIKNRAGTRILLGMVVASEEDPQLRTEMTKSTLVARRAIEQVLGVPKDDVDARLLEAMIWGLQLQHLLFEGHQSAREVDALIARLTEWVPEQRRKK